MHWHFTQCIYPNPPTPIFGCVEDCTKHCEKCICTLWHPCADQLQLSQNSLLIKDFRGIQGSHHIKFGTVSVRLHPVVFGALSRHHVKSKCFLFSSPDEYHLCNTFIIMGTAFLPVFGIICLKISNRGNKDRFTQQEIKQLEHSHPNERF